MGNEPSKVDSNPALEYIMIYDLFMFLWTTEFIQAISTMTVAGAVSQWYFAAEEIDEDDDVATKGKTSHEDTGNMYPCLCSWWTSIRFHMGTAAIGSLLIAIVQTVRVLFEYIEHK